MRHVIGLGLGLALVFAGQSGCASDPGRPTGASTAAPAVIVRMNDVDYKPDLLTIESGQTVEWRNESLFSWYTVTCDPVLAGEQVNVELPREAEPFNSGRLNPGGRYRHTFSTPGVYQYFSVPDESLGMLGQIIVKPPPVWVKGE